ncbi:MAG: alpha/beta fold hydrolase, partial [Myxococcota bacterium]
RVAEWINRSLNELQTRHGFERLCVVGHSMGGLVAREVANLHVARSGAPFLRGIVTIAAPLGGLDSAQFGVDWSPSVAPSWRDLAPESGFLRSLYRRPLPDYVAYDLLFTFHETEGDDTVVDIRSQLREEAQREANRVRGFEATHAGVLESGSAWEFIEANLNDCVGSPL